MTIDWWPSLAAQWRGVLPICTGSPTPAHQQTHPINLQAAFLPKHPAPPSPEHSFPCHNISSAAQVMCHSRHPWPPCSHLDQPDTPPQTHGPSGPPNGEACHHTAKPRNHTRNPANSHQLNGEYIPALSSSRFSPPPSHSRLCSSTPQPRKHSHCFWPPCSRLDAPGTSPPICGLFELPNVEGS